MRMQIEVNSCLGYEYVERSLRRFSVKQHDGISRVFLFFSAEDFLCFEDVEELLSDSLDYLLSGLGVETAIGKNRRVSRSPTQKSVFFHQGDPGATLGCAHGRRHSSSSPAYYDDVILSCIQRTYSYIHFTYPYGSDHNSRLSAAPAPMTVSGT